MGLEPLSYGLEATMGSRWTTLDDFVQYDDTNKVELPRIL